jgi:hypothetical protein
LIVVMVANLSIFVFVVDVPSAANKMFFDSSKLFFEMGIAVPDAVENKEIDMLLAQRLAEDEDDVEAAAGRGSGSAGGGH